MARAKTEKIEKIRRQKISEVMKGNQNAKGHVCTKEAKEKMRQKAIGKNNSMYDRKQSKETKRKISLALLGKNKGRKHTEEAKRNMSEGQKGIPSGMLGKYQSEEAKKKMSIARIKYFNNKQIRKKLSLTMKKLWLFSEFAQKRFKIFSIKPNKPEIFLTVFLNELLPNEYKYVGDGEFILAGKCPDFINVNGQKKIIELFGDYWHANPKYYSAGDLIHFSGNNLIKAEDIWRKNKDRINLFKQYGYQTLIVWESGLKNKELLKDKILQFHNLKKYVRHSNNNYLCP